MQASNPQEMTKAFPAKLRCRSAKPGQEHHVLVGAKRLIVTQRPLGATKLLGDPGQSHIERGTEVLVARFSALRPEAS
jgi:hypothetical protein